MTIYYLYVKTHKITGLKYLGYTKKSDPVRYLGSGDYWTKHLIKHGKEITTEILHECQSKVEIKERGLYYSELWDIVYARNEHGKKIWANLKPESGDGGATPGRIVSQETRMKQRLSRIGKHVGFPGSRLGHSTPPEVRAKQAAAKIGKKQLPEHIAKRAATTIANGSQRGKIRSVEARAKGAASNTGKKQPLITCPHCGKMGGDRQMHRYHFDSCRNNILQSLAHSD